MSTPRVLATWRPVKIPSGQFRDKFQATPIAGWWKRRHVHLILRIWKKSEVVWHLNKQFSKSLPRRIDFWIVSLQLLENQQKDLDFRRSGFLHQGLFKKNMEISKHPFCAGGSPLRIPSHELPQIYHTPQLVPTFAGGLSWRWRQKPLEMGERWNPEGMIRSFWVKSAI